MKTYGGVDVWIQVFLTLALVEDESLVSRPGRLISGKNPPLFHWIGCCMGPGAVLDAVKKINFLTVTGFKLRPLGLPVHSRSALFRLLKLLLSKNCFINIIILIFIYFFNLNHWVMHPVAPVFICGLCSDNLRSSDHVPMNDMWSVNN
jgi:hypothetical protein